MSVLSWFTSPATLFVNFVAWALVVDGVTTIMTQAKLFEGLRNFLKKISPEFWGRLIGCPKCFGFWVGVLAGILGLAPAEMPPEWPRWLTLWGLGAAGSIWCWSTFVVRKKLSETLDI